MKHTDGRASVIKIANKGIKQSNMHVKQLPANDEVWR